MDPRLSSLIELQQVLSEQKEIETEFNAVPERRNEIEAILQKLRDDVSSAEERIKANEVERSNSELDLQKGQETRVRKESQLHSIKNEKEYKATITEIENLDRRNTRLEEKIINLLDQIEKDKKEIQSKTEDLAAKEETFKAELTELDEREKSISPRLDDAKTRVDEVSKRVAPALYSRFLAVFKGKNGKAVAPANDGHCGGCNIRLTPRIMQLAKRGQDIVQCEGCSRFLYWDHSMEEEQLGAL